MILANSFRCEVLRSNLWDFGLRMFIRRIQLLKKLEFSSIRPISSSSFVACDVVDSRISEEFHEENRKLPPFEEVETGVRSRFLKERLRRYSGMLHDCVSKGCLNDGRGIHGQVIKNVNVIDSHLWISLINMYAKCGCLVYARRVFDVMPERNVVSWTSLIAGVVSEGDGRYGVSLFWEMYTEGIQPNEFTLASCLKACSTCADLDFGKQIHAEVIKFGFDSDIFVASGLVMLYAKCDEMSLADRVFVCMPKQNTVLWNTLLNGYAQIGDGKMVMKLFSEMTEPQTKFSKFTLCTVLKGFANSKSLTEAQVVHSLVIKSGSHFDEFVGIGLVDMYSKCGLCDDALRVFADIRAPDIVTWSAKITCLGQGGKSKEAAHLFHLMRCLGVLPNQFTLSSIVSTATDLGNLHFGESIHACVYKYGFKTDIPVSNALVTMYMQMGRMQQGVQVFETMKNQDLVSWNALLSGFIECETCYQGFRIFQQILLKGFKPNMYTFVSVLKSCSNLLDISFGKQVHAHIIKSNLVSNISVAQALVSMYGKNKFLEDAEICFNVLSKRDIIAWTTIITCYAQTDQAENAIKCFGQMQREGVNPNEYTLASCLSGCAHIAALKNGQQLHCMASKTGQLGDIFVTTAVLDMYAKCGCIEDAKAVIEGSVSRDTILWTALICGYSKHGLGEKALEAYSMMLNEGSSPDEVTFSGILSACSHTGLIEEGKKHFHSLKKIYGYTPSDEHCASMVDILGRAGQFDEISNFIKDMNLSTNRLIWETVLGACNIHGNVTYGETAANKLFELEPDVASNYILLSNIYAAKSRWNDFRKTRKLMSSQGVKKEVGCSWVEVAGKVHIFLSQDCSHSKIREIHLKLEELEHALRNITEDPEFQNTAMVS